MDVRPKDGGRSSLRAGGTNPSGARQWASPPGADRRPWWRATLTVALALALGPATASAQVGGPCGPPVTNPIACENTQPGTPETVWGIDGAGDPSIQGFPTTISVNKGETVSFKVKSATANYKANIYRLGWYGGAGARLMASNVTPTDTGAQPACMTDSATGLIDCGNWSVSMTWNVPLTAVSGVYIAHLIRNDTGGASHMTFVVRDDSSSADVMLQTSDSSWVAYNTWGGNSLYKCTVACPPGNPDGYKAAYKVSYNRPLNSAVDDVGGRSFLWWSEYPMIRFLERSGYNMAYTTNVDVHRRGSLLRNHKLFISHGHDEYWSQTQRDNVEAARDAGVNLAFFTGNEIFWKTRWEPSIAPGAAQDRTLVSYKDTHFPQQQDPVEWTGTWRDPRFTSGAARPVPENALTGQSFLVNSGTSTITVPEPYGKLRLWRNTAAANLSPGQSLPLAPSTLGFEWDEDADNGFRPKGQFRLSQTTATGLQTFVDYGSFVTENATATHHLTAYRAASGALVFGAGTVQWSWGLDSYAGNAENATMQQATLNLFADMSVQPHTVLSGLTRATKSTDTTPPTSTIAAPAAGATLTDGSVVNVTGTALDVGGAVAGVEVSTDNGKTWHPATSGTTSWSYRWVVHGHPSTTILVRATDDSGNTETPGAGRTVDVSCPCSIWGDGVVPAKPDNGDPSAIEVGVKFKSERFGTIDGIRFYKSTANTGTHTGSLWSTSGTRLAQVTFTNETASGWQSATFDKPVQVEPGRTYIASYHAPNGRYAATAHYLYPQPAPGPNGGSVTESAPLSALRNEGTVTNGVYQYGATSTFPASSFGATNYWVDVIFRPIPPPGAVSNVQAAAAGRTSATVTWSAPTSGGAVTSYKITPYVGSTAQAPTTISGSPPSTTATVTGLQNGTAYTFTVQASNPAGSGPESSKSNSVTPLNPVAPSAPTGVVARAASQSALVSWSAPEADGDSPITGYTVTPYVGGTAQAAVRAAASARSLTIEGLTNGVGYSFRVSATNDVGTGPQSDPSATVEPQATIFDFSAPANADSGETNPIELGVKFTSSSDGWVKGVRFYKATANTGTHIGSLWTAGGTRLAQATFANESASGWQSVTFSSPVAVTAGTTYVASYHAPAGHYAASPLPTQGVTNGPLTALANATSANGVYAYSATSTFPTSSYNGTNYWVDVLFAVPPPGTPTSVTATEAGRTSATVSWTAPTSGGTPSSYRVTPYVGSTAQASTTISGNPPLTTATVSGLQSATTYTFRVTALNANGAGPESAASNSVTPMNPVAPPPPTSVIARPATKSVHVAWTPPGSDGDSPITGYTITPYIGTVAQAPVQAPASATSATIADLKNGTAYSFRVSATNDVGAGAQSAPSAAVTPRSTIFDFAAPQIVDAGDSSSIEVGVKFRADFSGQVTGVRFYKSAANTGTHTGSLWTASGTRLAQATFTGESASGWQTVTFDSPVSVTAGTTYVASYFAPIGRYSVTREGFAAGDVVNGALRALGNSTSANGVFAYSATSTFPTSTYNAGNYWVDVLFAMPAPGTPTNVTATAGKASATVSWTAPSGAVGSYTVTPYVGSTAQPAKTITGSPPATSTTVGGLTNGTAYTFRVTAANPDGEGPQSAASNSVTPFAASAPDAPTGVSAEADSTSAMVRWTAPGDGGSAITGYTITPYAGTTALPSTDVGDVTRARVTGLTNGTDYSFRVRARNAVGASAESAASPVVTPRYSIFELATPTVEDSGDANAIELGVKFRPDADGTITGVRFYKSAANTGTHSGSLWSAAGTRLATGTYGDETASGWQTLTFASPVAVTAGSTYVASYHAPKGRYAVTSHAFASAGVDNPPLRALANSTSANGVYAYSATSTFPTGSYNSANYWVDVLFAHAPPPTAPTNVLATPGPSSADVSWTAPTGGGAPTSYKVVPYIGTAPQSATTVTGSPPATSVKVTGLSNGTTYTFRVEAANAGGSSPPSAQSNAVTPLSATVPAAPTGVSAEADSRSAIVRWTAPDDGGSAITGYTITPYAGTTALPSTDVGDVTRARVTGLTNGTDYSFRVHARNAVGSGPQSAATAAVTPKASILELGSPAVVDSGDRSAVVLGVKFQADVSGSITGVRFHKSAANTGTHTGSLWTAGGTLLATGTFSGESASGWQTLTFSTPVAIAAATTYVASYLAPNGGYSVTSAHFSSGYDNPPLRAVSDLVSANGVYAYSTTHVFPTGSYNAGNYWVDVLFSPGP